MNEVSSASYLKIYRLSAAPRRYSAPLLPPVLEGGRFERVEYSGGAVLSGRFAEVGGDHVVGAVYVTQGFGEYGADLATGADN